MAAINSFAKKSTELDSPPRSGVSVTPSDSNELDFVARWILVGTDGTVELVLEKDSSSVVLTLKAGILYNICFKQVKAAGTSATNIVAFA